MNSIKQNKLGKGDLNASDKIEFQRPLIDATERCKIGYPRYPLISKRALCSFARV